METRVSRVKNVTGNGTWDWTNPQTGAVSVNYNFVYEMEDGTIFRCSHKKQDPHPIGKEMEYQITEKNAQYGDKGKFVYNKGGYQKNSFNNSGTPKKSEVKEDDRQIMIVRQTVLKAFAESGIFPRSEPEFEDMDRTVEWVMSGKFGIDNETPTNDSNDRDDLNAYANTPF